MEWIKTSNKKLKIKTLVLCAMSKAIPNDLYLCGYLKEDGLFWNCSKNMETGIVNERRVWPNLWKPLPKHLIKKANNNKDCLLDYVIIS